MAKFFDNFFKVVPGSRMACEDDDEVSECHSQKMKWFRYCPFLGLFVGFTKATLKITDMTK